MIFVSKKALKSTDNRVEKVKRGSTDNARANERNKSLLLIPQRMQPSIVC